MALDPIPYVARSTGEAADAPEGSIPIDLYGAGAGGETTPVAFEDITGTATADQIPNLPASKISSGTLAAARVPDLEISKITGLEARLAAIESQLPDGS